MTLFTNTPETFARPDFRMLRDGAFIMYLNEDVLQTDVQWLANHDYVGYELNCHDWKDPDQMHRDLRETLNFPAYYGNNLDALNDCLSELEFAGAGTFLLFRKFDSIDKELAHTVLDLFAHNAREHLLFGNLLIVLVQVDESNYQLTDFGSVSLKWNSHEWQKAGRK
ncbi:MAG: hypothetical protein EOO88_39765 [Pedobacter sp.]|nr:MAG: hypothetical protein EOO88_39765 [Pedobacter sp.]